MFGDAFTEAFKQALEFLDELAASDDGLDEQRRYARCHSLDAA